MGHTLIPTWDLIQTAGKPHSVIRVRNLQTTLVVGKDAWGRVGKAQPVLISAAVSLQEPFESASSEDAVTGSTVHYGVLSKAILDACQRTPNLHPKEGISLRDLAIAVLTELLSGAIIESENGKADQLPALLKPSIMKMVKLKIMLPKASLLGDGISETHNFMYNRAEEGNLLKSRILTLHSLRIPTLIGVNPNERMAKQLVLATVELDGPGSDRDTYNELEEIIVKTIEESSFQTLEALAAHIGQRIIEYYLIPIYASKLSKDLWNDRITISLEKPTAVTFADAPVVEMTIESNPDKNPLTKALQHRTSEFQRPPFPIQGRLEDWIRSTGG